MLQIDPSTEKGITQVETIKWCQDQINAVLEKYFNGKYKLQKGLRINFLIPTDGDMNDTIKVDISSLEPQDMGRLNQAISEAKEQFPFVPKHEILLPK